MAIQWHLWRRYVVLVIPVGFFYVGQFLDEQEIRRQSDFRDKSKLFGKERKEGDYDPWTYYFKK